MQTTKNVNIASVAYVIDDDAYYLLSSYIDDIASRIDLKNERDELMCDIECRISEILQERGVVYGKVVTKELVEFCITQIGEPSLFGEGSGDGSYDYKSHSSSSKPKRLLRDMEDKKIAGVCSGVAAFSGLDATVVRVVLFLLVLFYGCGILMYIIGWIVIPAALSKADKEHLKEMKNRINS